jgi:hypothetical protein
MTIILLAMLDAVAAEANTDSVRELLAQAVSFRRTDSLLIF